MRGSEPFLVAVNGCTGENYFLMNPQPLNYSPPQLGRPIFSTGAFVAVLIMGAVVTATAITAGRFEPVFRDFHTDLPVSTVILLSLSRIFLHDFGWLIIPLALFVVPLLWAAAFPPPEDPTQRRIRHRWLRLAATVFIMLWVLFTVIALFAPMISLIQSVSGPGGKK
jgi:hypothetical protein